MYNSIQFTNLPTALSCFSLVLNWGLAVLVLSWFEIGTLFAEDKGYLKRMCAGKTWINKNAGFGIFFRVVTLSLTLNKR